MLEMGGGASKWILSRLGAAAAQIDFKYPARRRKSRRGISNLVPARSDI